MSRGSFWVNWASHHSEENNRVTGDGHTDRTSDCGRDVVTPADLCDTHMNVSISDLKSDSVRFIKPLVSRRGDPAAGLQWSKTLKH